MISFLASFVLLACKTFGRLCKRQTNLLSKSNRLHQPGHKQSVSEHVPQSLNWTHIYIVTYYLL